jgi:hypothetical protein
MCLNPGYLDSTRYSQLAELCRMTSGLRDGLEICTTARHYQVSRSRVYAVYSQLEKQSLMTPDLKDGLEICTRARHYQVILRSTLSWLSCVA